MCFPQKYVLFSDGDQTLGMKKDSRRVTYTRKIVTDTVTDTIEGCRLEVNLNLIIS